MYHSTLLTMLSAAVASVVQPVVPTRNRLVGWEVEAFPRIASPADKAQRASAGEEAADVGSRMRNCFLKVDGIVRVNGRCLVYAEGGGEYTLNTWDRGKPAHSHFAVVTGNEDGVAEATWNADPAESHAMDPLGIVTMQNGCWVNRRARICAR